MSLNQFVSLRQRPISLELLLSSGLLNGNGQAANLPFEILQRLERFLRIRNTGKFCVSILGQLTVAVWTIVTVQNISSSKSLHNTVLRIIICVVSINNRKIALCQANTLGGY